MLTVTTRSRCDEIRYTAWYCDACEQTVLDHAGLLVQQLPTVIALNNDFKEEYRHSEGEMPPFCYGVDCTEGWGSYQP